MAKKNRECDLMENDIAKDMSGKTTRGSGSVYDDADVKNECFIVEAKLRNKKSFTVKMDDLNKVKKQARDRCKFPLLVYQNEDGRKIAVMDYDDLIPLLIEGGILNG